jgi:hypothetical protein
MCVLSGCDYTQERIRGISCSRAYKFIQKYHSISNLEEILNVGKLNYKRCLEIFLTDIPTFTCIQEKMDKETLYTFLVEERAMEQRYVAKFYSVYFGDDSHDQLI